MTKRSLKKCFERFLVWFKLHNRKVAAALAMVVFSILMVICVVVIFENDETMTHINIETEIESVNTVDQILDSDLPKNAFCEQLEQTNKTKEDCTTRFHCANIPKDLGYFAWVLQNQIHEKCESIAELKIQTSEFESPLQELWLFYLKPSIMELTIQDCRLLGINFAAFRGHPFAKMTSLRLIDLYRLTELRKGSFYYLNSIQTFVIAYGSFHYGLQFDPKILNGMDSIQYLQIRNCINDPQTVADILSDKEVLTKLRVIDLSYNRLETILNNMFKNAENLREIYLNNNLLTLIEPLAFWEIPLEVIRINNNQLTYLEPQNFYYIHPTLARIYASSNPWECICKLQWFKDFSTSTLMNNEIPLVCKDGSRFDAMDTFCNTPTTPRIVICEPHFEFPLKVPMADKAVQLVDTTLRIISEQDVHIEVFDIEGEEGIVEVVLSGDYIAYYLLWFPSGKTSNYGCLSEIKGSVVLDNMTRGDDYTLCLIATEYSYASPFECLGFRVLPIWSEQTWLANKYQGMAIGLACTIIVVVAITTAIAMFYFIRQRPYLLKGNKRVIIVESKQADAIVMPKQYQGDPNECYNPPSLISYGQGYLRAVSPHNNTYTYFEPIKLAIRGQEEVIKRDSVVPAYDDPPYVKKRSSQTGSVILAPPLPPPNANMRMTVTFDENDGLHNHYSTA